MIQARLERQCPYCQEWFEVASVHSKKKFCSDACAIKYRWEEKNPTHFLNSRKVEDY